MITTDEDPVFYRDLIAILGNPFAPPECPASEAARDAHAAPPGSACTPEEWFGPTPPAPVHGRNQDATQVMQAVGAEQEARAS